jgi:thymidylate synthase
MMSTIKLEGEVAAPRGLPTLELLHCLTRVEQPQRRVLTIPGRKLNPFFNMAESLWILNGQSEAWWILYFNSQLQKFLDAPMTDFYGAYGERLRKWPRVKAASAGLVQDIVLEDQLMDCFWTLHTAPESRQAAMILRNPIYDKNGKQTMDRPCNIAVTFKIRQGKLWMSVFNRSNDMVLGLTSTNIVQFTSLQETLASWLGVDVGPYSHYSDSLHIYDSQDVQGQTEHFNVYEYINPLPMRRMTPAESDGVRTKLYSDVGDLIRQHDNQYIAAELSRTMDPLACPYWTSVGHALYAYIAHKNLKDWRLALDHIEAMQTDDWKIECLRHLADRYAVVNDEPHRSFIDAVNNTFRDIPIRGGLIGARAVWLYVFQSHLDMLERFI